MRRLTLSHPVFPVYSHFYSIVSFTKQWNENQSTCSIKYCFNLIFYLLNFARKCFQEIFIVSMFFSLIWVCKKGLLSCSRQWIEECYGLLPTLKLSCIGLKQVSACSIKAGERRWELCSGRVKITKRQ